MSRDHLPTHLPTLYQLTVIYVDQGVDVEASEDIQELVDRYNEARDDETVAEARLAKVMRSYQKTKPAPVTYAPDEMTDTEAEGAFYGIGFLQPHTFVRAS